MNNSNLELAIENIVKMYIEYGIYYSTKIRNYELIFNMGNFEKSESVNIGLENIFRDFKNRKENG